MLNSQLRKKFKTGKKTYFWTKPFVVFKVNTETILVLNLSKDIKDFKYKGKITFKISLRLNFKGYHHPGFPLVGSGALGMSPPNLKSTTGLLFSKQKTLCEVSPLSINGL